MGHADFALVTSVVEIWDKQSVSGLMSVNAPQSFPLQSEFIRLEEASVEVGIRLRTGLRYS